MSAPLVGLFAYLCLDLTVFGCYIYSKDYPMALAWFGIAIETTGFIFYEFMK